MAPLLVHRQFFLYCPAKRSIYSVRRLKYRFCPVRSGTQVPLVKSHSQNEKNECYMRVFPLRISRTGLALVWIFVLAYRAESISAVFVATEFASPIVLRYSEMGVILLSHGLP